MKNSEILSNAADYIKTNGWHQGDAYGPHHSACMIGSLVSTKVILGNYGQIIDALEKVLFANYGENQIAIVNDELMTHSDEPIAMLQKAALIEEEAGR